MSRPRTLFQDVALAVMWPLTLMVALASSALPDVRLTTQRRVLGLPLVRFLRKYARVWASMTLAKAAGLPPSTVLRSRPAAATSRLVAAKAAFTWRAEKPPTGVGAGATIPARPVAKPA